MSAIPQVTLNDGHTIPQLGFGVWEVPPDVTEDVVNQALAAGYRHIDTAAVYGNEEAVGRAVAASGIPRDELFITTKLWITELGEQKTPAAFHASLEKLGLDYVDLYLIHWPAPATDDYLEAYRAIERLRSEGLTRSIGVSNFEAEHLDRVIDLGGTVPAVNQIELNPYFQNRAGESASRERNIAVQGWSPLGKGASFEEPAITDAAAAHGVTPAQVVLRWHLQRERIIFPRSVTPERIVANADLFGFELSDDELSAIDGLDRDQRSGPRPEDVNP